MPPRRTRSPINTPPDAPTELVVPHLTVISQVGRPKKPTQPPKPNFGFTKEEQQRYDWFLHCFDLEYPDLSPSDWMLLELAGVTYIKLLRMNAVEIETGQLVTMARQNPSTDFTRYMDMLSTTRKQRQKTTPANPDDRSEELLTLLSGNSR